MSTHHESTNEPVAWYCEKIGKTLFTTKPSKYTGKSWQPLYTTQPQDQKKDEAFRMEHALRLALEAAQLGLDYAKSEQYENKHRYKGYEHLAPDDAYCIGVFEKAITLIEQALENK